MKSPSFDLRRWAVGEWAMSQYGPCEIIGVNRNPSAPVAGKYTIKSESGLVDNYPGYLLKTLQASP